VRHEPTTPRHPLSDPGEGPSADDRAGAKGRRHFLKSTIALAASIHGLPARADTGGRVVFGFTVTPTVEAVFTEIVRQLQSRYRPDLGARPVYLPGNSALLATESVLKAPADGAAVLLSSSASMTLLPLVRKEMMDPYALLHPVAGIAPFIYAFVVGPAVPPEVKTMAQYLAWANANPVLANYGVPGRGAATHYIGTEIARMSKTPLKSVAYKGLAAVIEDVAKGGIPAVVTTMVASSDLARLPSLRVLAVSGAKRWFNQPDVPTLVEIGLAESPTESSTGFYLSARTPPEKIAELNDAIHAAMLEPSVRKAMDLADWPPLDPGVDYAQLVASERADWQARIARHGFSADS
jgi:tripartite-type tricarboxylate transporter receptor subunit TctC